MAADSSNTNTGGTATKGGGQWSGKSWASAISMAAHGYGAGMNAYWNRMATETGIRKDIEVKRFEEKEIRNQLHSEAFRNDLMASRLKGEQTQTFSTSVDMSGAAIDVLVNSMKELSLDKAMSIRNAQAAGAVKQLEIKDKRKALERARKAGRMSSWTEGVPGM